MSDKAKSDQQALLDGGMTAYERWELPSLGPDDEAANEVEIEPVTQQEVDQIRADAYAEGHKKGLDKGFKEGSESGHKEGHKKGLEAGKKEGLKQGIEQGHQQGLNQGQAEIQQQLTDLSAIMAGFQPAVAQQTADVNEALLNVVTAVSRAVVHRELQMSRSQIDDLLNRGLAILDGSKETVEVTVNPADLLMVERAAEEAGADWKIHTDDALTPGGVQLKSGPSIVDLSAEKRFQQAVMNLLGRTDWAMDLASGHASETQQQLTSLSDGFEAPVASDTLSDADPMAEVSQELDGVSVSELENDLADDIASSDLTSSNETPVQALEADDDLVNAVEPTEKENNAAEVEAKEESVNEAFAVEESVIDDSVVEDSVIKDPAVEDLVAEDSVVEDPVVENSVVESSEIESSEVENSEVESSEIESSEVEDSAVEPSAIQETPDHTQQESFSASDDSQAHEPETAAVITSDDIEIDHDIIDFDASQQDENTTIYEQAPTVSDLAEQHALSESSLSVQADETLAHETSAEGPSEPPLMEPEMTDQTAQHSQTMQQSAEHPQSPVNSTPEVQPMMQASPHNPGFEAFGWQQTAPSQPSMQQAQMQANNASMQAQQAQAQAQQAQAQAQQAQAHAQAMAQQAQAQASQAQMMSQQAHMAQAQAGMMQPAVGAMPQPPLQQPMSAPMPNNSMPNAPMAGGMMAPQPGYQPPYGQAVNPGWVPSQPVPMVPVQGQPGFSVYSYHGNGMNPAAGQPTANHGFMPANYQNL